MNARGEIVFWSPTGSDGGYRNIRLSSRIDQWAERDGTGACGDSNTGYTLPNGAVRSPDTAWIRQSRLDALTAEDMKDEFWHVCPNFVIELRSKNDRVKDLKEKMEEYIQNGAELGWLLDPYVRTAWVYRPGQPVQEILDAKTLSGDPELPGLILDVAAIFDLKLRAAG